MLQVNIHEAKTQLSMLVEKVAHGESFIIAKAGKPMAKVIPFAQSQKQAKRVGFLSGQIEIPDDFDQMGQDEVATMFGGHTLAVSDLPGIHKDPFDRMLLAQAIVDGMKLITADERVAQYPAPVVFVSNKNFQT